jgi:hypothetical protein
LPLRQPLEELLLLAKNPMPEAMQTRHKLLNHKASTESRRS